MELKDLGILFGNNELSEKVALILAVSFKNIEFRWTLGKNMQTSDYLPLSCLSSDQNAV